MNPNYIAKKSAWSVWNFWTVLLCLLVLPIVVQIFRTITVKKYRVEFYDDKIIVKSGWLNTKMRQMVFLGVTSVSTEQSLWGKLFHYGNIIVDCVGKWDVDTTYIQNPDQLVAYLQTRIVKSSKVSGVVHL